MGRARILPVATVHSQVRQPDARVGDHAHRPRAVHLGEHRRREILIVVGLAGEQLRDRRARIGDERHHDAIELRAAAIVRRVRHDLDALARLPLHETKTSTADGSPRHVGRPQLLARHTPEHMLRQDRHLVHEIVELLGRSLVIEHHGRQRVAHRNGIDVRQRRRQLRRRLRILVEVERELHVGGAYGLPVVPPRSGVDGERDGHGVRRPRPAFREPRFEANVADGVHVGADLCQAVVQLIHEQPRELVVSKRRQEGRRLRARHHDDDRAAVVATIRGG